MKRIPAALSLSLLAFGVSISPAAPLESWFEKANAFYEQEQYDSAALYYEEIIEAGTNNSAVYYNLGNAYFRLNNIGRAILHYEKARKIDPNDPDILNNIKFANLNIVDRIPAPKHGLLGTALRRLHTLFSLHLQIWMLFGFFLILSVLFSLGLFASRNSRLWIIYVSTLLVLAFVVVGISIGTKIYQEEKIPYAIVLTKSVDGMNQPKGNKVLFSAHEGTKFRIRKRMDDWSLVSLPNGVSGWVESQALGKI